MSALRISGQRLVCASVLLAAAVAVIGLLATGVLPNPLASRTPRPGPAAEHAAAPAGSADDQRASAAAATPSEPGLLPLPEGLNSRTVVRVALQDASVPAVLLSCSGPVEIRTVAAGQLLGTWPRLDKARCTAAGAGLKIGSRTFAETELELVPRESPALWVGRTQYRGTVRLSRRPRGRVLAVNVVPLEDYIASVINGEMPATFGAEARKAQAVVARTYVLTQLLRPRHPRLFDVYASTRSQKYLGLQYRDSRGRRLAGETAGSRKIAAATAGVVCTWEDQLFCTYYSAVCGGRTINGSAVFSDAAPPVTSVACRWCQPALRHRWQARIPRDTFRSTVARLAAVKGDDRLGTIQPVAAESTGQLPEFAVHLGSHRVTVSAEELHQRLGRFGLHSADFSLKLEQSAVLVEGRGHGHRAGLCQWGAAGMARDGYSWQQILAHYYPGVELARLGQREQPGAPASITAAAARQRER